DIGGSAAIILARIDPVACKPSNLDILGVGHNRRQASGKCELNDTGALGREQPVRRYNDGLRPLLGGTVECGSEIIGCVRASWISTVTPRARAAVSTCCTHSAIDAPAGLARNPIRVEPGTASSASSSSLVATPSTCDAMPVTLPPGRA